MNAWTRTSDTSFELIPNGSSDFVLQVQRTTAGKWQAFVSGEDVDEGEKFATLADAQRAALESYDSYWSDFESPT